MSSKVVPNMFRPHCINPLLPQNGNPDQYPAMMMAAAVSINNALDDLDLYKRRGGGVLSQLSLDPRF